MPKRTLNDAVKELWYWQYGTAPTNFTSSLFSLMQKADIVNLAALAGAFPMEYEALLAWMRSKDTTKFFKSYGIKLGKRHEIKTEKQ